MRTLSQFVPPRIVFGLLRLAAEPATEGPEPTGKRIEEIGDDADELNKALKSVTGLGESAAKGVGQAVWRGLSPHNLSPFALFVL